MNTKKIKRQIRNLFSLNRMVVVAAAIVITVLILLATAVQPKHDTKRKIEPIITISSKSVTETIPFKTQTNLTDKMSKGQSQINTIGSNGSKLITYTITSTDGIEIKRTSTESILIEPVDEIVIVGTCDEIKYPTYCKLVRDGTVTGEQTPEEKVEDVVEKLAPYSTTYN